MLLPLASLPSGSDLTLSSRAYHEIRARILRGEIQTGEALSRRALAAGLGISVPPVTEALLQLEAEGLLESRPRAGTRVRVPTREEIEDRAILREALECRSARLFAERATRLERDELLRLSLQMDEFYAACEQAPGDRDLHFSANSFHLNLHLRIAECARCGALRDAIEKEQVLVFSWLYDTAVERRSVASDCHERLARALTERTAAQAEAAMQRHIRQGIREVLERFDAFDRVASGWRQQRKSSAN